MNLEDVIDPEYGLQQDTFSEGRPRFGDQGQLEVIGWSGRQHANKFYILKCSTCAQDPELFGTGVFKCLRGGLIRGRVSCGCSRTHMWSEQQYATLCSRKAAERGYTFLGWSDEFLGRRTKTRMLCDKHGEWGTASINSLIHNGCGCPGCRVDAVVSVTRKPDDTMLASFFASGQFPEGTKFWRGDRVGKDGGRKYWYVHCPECSYVGESQSDSLQKGYRPCLCSPARQQQAYINWIVDDKNKLLALKFGIANVAKQRVKQQNARCIYEVRPYLIYNFPTKKQCLAAERECKETLLCGILSQEEMPDGHTETTCPSNLARIKSIYEKHGGVRYDALEERC